MFTYSGWGRVFEITAGLALLALVYGGACTPLGLRIYALLLALALPVTGILTVVAFLGAAIAALSRGGRL